MDPLLLLPRQPLRSKGDSSCLLHALLRIGDHPPLPRFLSLLIVHVVFI